MGRRKYKETSTKVKREFRNMKILRFLNVLKWVLVALAAVCCVLIRLFYRYNADGNFYAVGEITQVYIANIAAIALPPIVCLSALLFLIGKLAKGGEGKGIIFVTALIVFLCGGAVGYVMFNNRNALENMRLNEFKTPDNKHTLYYVESKGERTRVIYRRTGKFVYEKALSFDTSGWDEEYFPGCKWGSNSFSDSKMILH